MTTSNDLLNFCPFCRSSKVSWSLNYGDSFFMECDHCKARGPSHFSYDVAAVMWNAAPRNGVINCTPANYEHQEVIAGSCGPFESWDDLVAVYKLSLKETITTKDKVDAWFASYEPPEIPTTAARDDAV